MKFPFHNRHKHDWMPLNVRIPPRSMFTQVTVQCMTPGCGKTKVKEHRGRIMDTEAINRLYPNHPIVIEEKTREW